MSAVPDARRALADAFTTTGVGIICTPYPPDSVVAPAAWVESVTVDYADGAGWSFCGTGAASARIVAVATRNDRAGSLEELETAAPTVNSALEGIDGVRIVGWETGTADVNQQTLPAVIWQLQFVISER